MSKPDFAGVYSGDWHIDKTRGLEDTARCVDFVIAETIRRRDLLGRDVPFAFTNGGDGYRNPSPDPAESSIMHRTRLLKQNGIESEIIVANHDLRESDSELGDIVHAFVDMKNLGGAMTVVEEPTIAPIKDAHGNTLAYRFLIPHLGKAKLQRAGLTYPQMFKQTLDNMISEVPVGSRIIVVSHFFVREAKVGPCDHVIGGDQLVPLADLQDPRLLLVLLSDIHKAQKLSDSPLVLYPGSIDRVDFGEAEDPKGFIYYEVRGTDVKIEFVPTPARRFVHIVADLIGPKAPGDLFSGMPDSPQDLQPWLEEKMKQFDTKGAKVKLTVRCGPNLKGAIDDRKLTDVLFASGADGIRSVNFDVVTAENRRAPEVTEGLSKIDALNKWLGYQSHSEKIKQSILSAGEKIIGEKS